MVCKDCKKDFNNGISAAYQLGIQDGEKRSKRRFDVLARTNHQLWEQLNIDDAVNPLDVNTIRLTVEVAEDMLKALRKKSDYYHANMLRRIIKDQVGSRDSQERKLRKKIEKADRKTG